MLTSTAETNFSFPLKNFPNPVNEILYVELPNEIQYPYQYVITNPEGKIQLKSSIELFDSMSIDIGSLAPGFYIIQVICNDQKSSGKFVKE